MDCSTPPPFQYPWYWVLGIPHYCGTWFFPHIVTDLLVLSCCLGERGVLKRFGLWTSKEGEYFGGKEGDLEAEMSEFKLDEGVELPPPEAPDVGQGKESVAGMNKWIIV